MICADLINSTSSSVYNPWSQKFGNVPLTADLSLNETGLRSKAIPFDTVASPDDFPLINNQPLVYTLILAYLCCLIKLLPNFMSTRSPFNLRPLLVIFNGLMFGAYWSGFVIFVYCFPPWRYIMYGEAATAETPLTKVYYMYLHNLIFWARFVDLVTPIFKLLTKKDSSSAILHGVYTSIIVTSYSMGYELESKEPYTILPMFDALKVIIRIIYHIPTAPGEKNMQGCGFRKSTIHLINILINVIGLSSFGYLFTTNYNFSRNLYSCVIIVTLAETSFHLFGIFNINLFPKSSKQPKQLVD